MATDDATEPTPDQEREVEDRTEARYRRGVGLALALLALLGAWIAVLATNAATNESRTAREATRVASEAQTADVVSQGAQAGLDQVTAEIAQFATRSAFQVQSAVEEFGIQLDPAAEADRLAKAQEALEDATRAYGERKTGIDEQAAQLSLEQTATVAERVTWNDRASQYETVLTVLAVAIFLVGFTMVVSRNLRPPFVVPGVVLAVVCFGWALQIHAKPIPTVAPDAIDGTAAGQVAIDEGRADDAVADFTAAIEAQDDYELAHRGLGTAVLLTGNPDLFRTWAITDASPELVDEATAELDRALELGGSDDPQTVATAALVAVVGSEWDRAAQLLDDAVAENERTPGLQLSRSAVAVAQGDQAAAEQRLIEAVGNMQELAGTDTDRALAAQYLTLLEWVSQQVPEQADLARQLRDQGIALVAEARADETPQAEFGPDAEAPAGADVAVEELEFVDGFTNVRLAVTGVDATDQVITAAYERPSPDGPWVQPPELFYVGPPPPGAGYTFRTPRACHPVEYRVDLYVNGVYAASTTSPGGAATC
jgi:hypothetical protein